MAYTPTTWHSGDLISSEKLNKMEQGIAGSGGGVLVVTATNGTLNKTWQEIHDAAPLVWVENSGYYMLLTACAEEEGAYWCGFLDASDLMIKAVYYAAASASGYPTLSEDDGGFQ